MNMLAQPWADARGCSSTSLRWRNRRLLVSVMVDEPCGDIYGGTVAAPALERIMEFALPYLKIPPQ